MSADIIQSEYEELAQIARRFHRRATAIAVMQRQMQAKMRVLEQGSWRGRGASAFYTEMNSDTLPAVRRLEGALEEAHRSTCRSHK